MLCMGKKVPGWWKRPWAVGRRHWVMPCGAAPTFTVTSSFASRSRDSWSSPAGMNHTGATQQRTDRLAPRPMTWKKLVSMMLVLLFNKKCKVMFTRPCSYQKLKVFSFTFSKALCNHKDSVITICVDTDPHWLLKRQQLACQGSSWRCKFVVKERCCNTLPSSERVKHKFADSLAHLYFNRKRRQCHRILLFLLPCKRALNLNVVYVDSSYSMFKN